VSGRVLDVSRPIHAGMEIHPGDPGVGLTRVRSIAAGAPVNVSELRCGVHTGTHVDAPVHVIDGAGGVECLPLEAMVGPALVVDARDVRGGIDGPTLNALAPGGGPERLLLATGEAGALDAEAARLLVRRGVRLVGVDRLSVGGPETHDVLLRAGVVVLEGLRLDDVPPGRHHLTCLPLLLPGSDGAPARALLRIEAA